MFEYNARYVAYAYANATRSSNRLGLSVISLPIMIISLTALLLRMFYKPHVGGGNDFQNFHTYAICFKGLCRYRFHSFVPIHLCFVDTSRSQRKTYNREPYVRLHASLLPLDHSQNRVSSPSNIPQHSKRFVDAYMLSAYRSGWLVSSR